jgi:hypothetical protein
MQTGANAFGTLHDSYEPMIEDHNDERRLFYVAPLLFPPAMALARLVELRMFPPNTEENKLYSLYIISFPDRRVWGEAIGRQFSVFSVPREVRPEVDMMAKGLGIGYAQAIVTQEFPAAKLFQLLSDSLHARHPTLFPKDFLVDSPLSKMMDGNTVLTTLFPIRGERVLVLTTGQRKEERAQCK